MKSGRHYSLHHLSRFELILLLLSLKYYSHNAVTHVSHIFDLLLLDL